MTVININVGVLGHVDSGKTSLCKALSTTSSTACFDKNPQSKERGITLDLGFSSFRIENSGISNETKSKLKITNEDLLFTLVDCPGHASLIKTIICGAKIIDVMILVIDVVRGIQTQTAECLVIGEILCDKVLVVFNKVDLLTDKNRNGVLTKLEKRVLNVLSKSKIKSYKMVECSAVNTDNSNSSSISLDKLKMSLLDLIENPVQKRLESSRRDPLLYAVDHCFGIRGQGTILTGTILSGSMEVGNSLHIPSLDTDKKIKSIQMFKKPVTKAIQGDRVGVCVTQLDPSQLERGLLCLSQSQKSLYIINSCLIRLSTISYYKQPIKSKQSKFHVTIGLETVMGNVILFSTGSKNDSVDQFDWTMEYIYEHEYSNEMEDSGSNNEVNQPKPNKNYYALVQLEKPVVCAENSLLIGSKFDTDIQSNVCRLAFYGNILWMKNISGQYTKDFDLQKLKIFKTKSRIGYVERFVDPYTAIVKDLFKKETNIEVFRGLKVHLVQVLPDSSHGDSVSSSKTCFDGVIEGNFGQSGKCKIRLHDELPADIVSQFSSSKKKKKQNSDDFETTKISIQVVLNFKKFMFCSDQVKICQ